MGSSSSKVGDYDIDLKSIIGEGGFGVVYKGSHKKSKEIVAIKKCPISSHGEVLLAMKEIKSMENIRSNVNIVKLYAFHFHNDAAWIVMEMCDIGDLDHYVKKYRPNIEEKLNIMMQCVEGVMHMHRQDPQIVHRDLKPRNILFKRDREKHVVKIGDFGLSKVVNNSAKLKTVGGTVLYMAPELMLSKDYDSSVDIFALGLVFLAMMLFELVGELVPLSVSAMKKGDVKPIAMEMCDCKMSGNPLPTVIVIVDSDSPKERIVKQLIRDMVVFTPDKRIPLKKVCSEFKAMLSMEPSSVSMISQLSGERKGSNLGQALLDILQEQKCNKNKEIEKWDKINQALLQLVSALDINVDDVRTGSSKKKVVECDSGVHANMEPIPTELDEGAGVYALLNAACNGNIQELKRMQANGIDMDLSDYDGRTALHLSAAEGSMDCVVYLMEQCHVKHNPKDRWGHTPYDEAVNFHQSNVAKYLQTYE